MTPPAGTLLAAYARGETYTDCYSIRMDRTVSLSEFMAAFYTTPLFKVERWLLARFVNLPSTDLDARELALGNRNTFAAWTLEAREADQAILAARRTRSWFMVSPHSPDSGEGTLLYFGSAVLPHRQGGLGWQYRALLGFHKHYSRALLSAAARRLTRKHE